MPGMFHRVLAAYPDAAPEDFRLQDDGEGPFLARWNEEKLGPAPDLSALPDAPEFGGEVVLSAADVDRVTAGRIRALLAPAWESDPGMATMRLLRRAEELLVAIYMLLANPDATREEKNAAKGLLDREFALRETQIRSIRDEAEAFKAERGLK